MDSTNQTKTVSNRADVYEHDNYNNPGWSNNDICLIKLPSPFTFDDYVQPIPLPLRSHVPYSFEGEKVIISGWGLTSDAATSTSNILQFVEMTVENQEVCVSNFNDEMVTEKNICVNSDGGTKGGCHADSGGPMVSKCNGRLLGVYSVVDFNGCETEKPHVYMRVANYLDWIKEITGLNV